MMSRQRNYDDDEIDDDESSDGSDIQEIAVIPAPTSNKTPHDDEVYHQPVKRRKSSPQMDPIPSYNPTPLHILEQRSREKKANTSSENSDRQSYCRLSPSYGFETSSSTYNPTPIGSTGSAGSIDYTTDSSRSSQKSSSRNHNDYVPLLEPSPSVVGRTTVVPDISSRGPRSLTLRPSTTIRRAPPANSVNALRPVSSALAQAVARRRTSQVDKEQSKISQLASMNKSSTDNLTHDTSESSSYAEEPVMWSPQLPSQIQPVKDEAAERLKAEEDEYNSYKSPRMTKQRVAHKPTIPQNKQKRPRAPLGVAKKVPISFRMKYLDVVINEYLNTGHPEEASYKDALKEEEAIAGRAANRSIYMNLIAGLKKRIREKAGVSTLPQDNSTETVNGNKVISHSEILTGKVKGTFSIERKRKNCDPAELNEHELYDRLMRYTVPVEVLEDYGYPSPDPVHPTMRKVPLGKDGQKLQLREELATSYTCERCTKIYRVDPEGMPLSTTSKCIYHPGHLWNERINRALEKRYSCCKGDPSAGGCSSNPYHVHKGELEMANYQGFVETLPKPDREPNKHGIYALDCEMCYTTHGLELTRVTVINYKFDVVYERLVRPLNPILDYNTKFSGIKEGDLDHITTSLWDVQQDLLELFSTKSMLVGHSLDSDMKALKLFHKRFIDTAQLFPHKRGLPFKRALRTLMVENLRVIIQEDVGHDSKEDASAAFKLVMWKAKTDVPEKAPLG